MPQLTSESTLLRLCYDFAVKRRGDTDESSARTWIPRPDGADHWHVGRIRVVAAPDKAARNCPVEILLHILQYMIQDLSILQDRRILEAALQERDWRRIRELSASNAFIQLRNLALVCQAWYYRVAPFLRSRLVGLDEIFDPSLLEQ